MAKVSLLNDSGKIMGKNGIVVWFTGRSGSGKTTIANGLRDKLKQLNYHIKIIDGDDVRNSINKHLGFAPEDIKENNRIIINFCLDEMKKNDFVLVPVISPFIESRSLARKLIGKYFFELYIKADIKTCASRDPKGLYKKALNGEIENFIGIAENVPYEEPLSPELTIDTCKETIENSINLILEKLSARM